MSALVFYGNVSMIRARCPNCNHPALIVKGRFSCCGAAYDNSLPTTVIQESAPQLIRRRPNHKRQQEILLTQSNRCAYCDREFGSWTTYHGKLHRITVCWDHLSPLIYSYNNQDENFLAACRPCNNWKSCKVFANVEEIRAYVAEKWLKAG